MTAKTTQKKLFSHLEKIQKKAENLKFFAENNAPNIAVDYHTSSAATRIIDDLESVLKRIENVKEIYFKNNSGIPENPEDPNKNLVC